MSATPSRPEDLACLREEVTLLRREMGELRASIARLHELLEGAEPAARPPAAASVPASTLLARRNAGRIGEEVRRRLGIDPGGMAPAFGGSVAPQDDTAVDLLIDRLHDLAVIDPGPPP